MSIVRVLILLLAGGAALLAALMVRGMTGAPVEVQPVSTVIETPEVVQTKVLVSAKDLSLGARIAPEDIAWKAWPEDGISEAFFTDEDAPDAITDLAGSVVRVELIEGEPITARKLVQPGDAGFMAAVLTPGKRAVAVAISVETAAGGFILPNDRVDVILTREIEVQNGDFIVTQPTAETILQNVRVLAIDQTFGTMEDEETILASTATLELEPNQTESLTLAQHMGDITLSLRSVSDGLIDAAALARARNLNEPQTLGGTVKVYRSSKQSDAVVGGSQ